MQEKRESEAQKRREEIDRFWQIDDLIPQKKAVHYPHSTETTEVILEPSVPKMPAAHRQDAAFAIPHRSAEEKEARAAEEYEPAHALLHKVRLYRWKNDFGYYNAFLRDAVRLYAIHGEPCESVPDFYRMSQYSQMSRPQLEWYLWWRENFRKGVMLETDYSYLLLYANEMVNLSQKLPPKNVRDALSDLWIHYRNTYCQLDAFLPEWIAHCCLIHHLPPPAWEDPRLVSAAMQHCRLREFYLSSVGEDSYWRALLAFCSNYDYQKSKFYKDENAPLFDRIIAGALREVVEKTAEGEHLFAAARLEDSKILLDAYMGALCTAQVKRRIEVEYCSFSRSYELRLLVTDIVKYTENRIRQAIGIRSRLSVYALPVVVRELLDAYLAKQLPARVRMQEPSEVAALEYEKLYDVPKKPFSLEEADMIERLSWDTTKRLVEAFEDINVTCKETAAPLPVEQVVASQAVKKTQDVVAFTPEDAAPDIENAHAMADYLPFLRAVQEGSAGAQSNAARALQLPLEVLADEVNAIAVDLYGDILLEECEGGYAVIEDYTDVLAHLLDGKDE